MPIHAVSSPRVRHGDTAQIQEKTDRNNSVKWPDCLSEPVQAADVHSVITGGHEFRMNFHWDVRIFLDGPDGSQRLMLEIATQA